MEGYKEAQYRYDNMVPEDYESFYDDEECGPDEEYGEDENTEMEVEW